jgi:hypothetical protein
MKLPALYQTIAQKASETTAWPDSTSFKRLLHRENADSPLRPPVFEAGTGPLSLIALFTPTSNPAALPLIHDCLSVRKAFPKSTCLDQMHSYINNCASIVVTPDL